MATSASPNFHHFRGHYLREFHNHLAGFLHQAQQGHSFVITSRDRVLAEIHPPARPSSSRRPGALKGRIRIGPEFDTLPPDILDAMEGDVL